MREACSVRIAGDLGGIELVEAVHPAPRFGRHAHPTYAIGLVSRGVNRFLYRGGWQLAPAGALCTVTPDEPHEVEPAEGGGFAYRCLYPSAGALREAAEAVAGRRVHGTLALPPVIADATAARLLAAVFRGERERAPRLAREAGLMALLVRVAARHARAPIAARSPTLPARAIERARDYLAAHVDGNVALATLAELSGLDRFSLIRGFTKAYGLPPHAWLLQRRVLRAKALLAEGRAAVEVAAELGFADQSHLTRHFRRLLGYTPGAWRRAQGAAGTAT